MLKKLKDITIVDVNDWIGIYINGKLTSQGHSFHTSELLKLIGVPHDYVFADSGWLVERGSLPENIEDVKLNK